MEYISFNGQVPTRQLHWQQNIIKHEHDKAQTTYMYVRKKDIYPCHLEKNTYLIRISVRLETQTFIE